MASNPLRGIPLLEDLPALEGMRVLVRVDFNVPLHIGVRGVATVADDFRIKAAVPTLQRLLDEGAEVVAASHLGRPSGAPDPRWEMDPVRARLEALCPGVELTENLRFDPGEKANDPAFVRRLIDGFGAYVDEAFGAAHRAHASIVGPPQFLPSAAGLRFAREIEVLGGILEDPARPFVAVVGGAKVADKLEVLKVLATKVDTLVVGGGMAYTFLAARGQHVGSSLLDESHLEDCRALLDSNVRILLPSDTRALEPGGTFGPPTEGFEPRGSVKVIEGDLPDGWTGLDIGPDSAAAFAEVVAAAGTVLWNGPLGAFEDHRFGDGTRVVAEAVANCPGFSVVGGGDSASALDELGLSDQVGYLSTGGGASLTFIESEGHLPGIDALRRRAQRAPGVSARRPLISGNWKMHHDHIEALHTVRDLGLRLKAEDVALVDVSVHPPFTDLRTVQTLVEKEHIPVALGAQHCSDEDAGARTGEVSPRFLARLGTTYVIVGHSERRTLYAMDDATVAATLRAVLRHEMTPVVCVGESEEQRDRGQTEGVLEEQVLAALTGLPGDVVGGLVIAYEPIWAIGTGRAATAVDAEDACVFIRSLVAKLGGDEAAAAVRLQYGGSVNAENAEDLMAEPDVDGLLVGGASLEAASFTDIIRTAGACYRS